jgi:hypothetical protein
MNISVGGLFEGIYWDSGVVETFARNSEKISLHTTSAGSLIGLFYGYYGQHFFSKLKSFLENKENPIKNMTNYDAFYENIYSQIISLIKLGTNKVCLYKSEELYKFFDKIFGEEKLKDLKFPVTFEVFNLKTGEIENLSEDVLIKDMLMMELSIPPYYESYEYNNGKYIPTGFMGLIPMKNPSNSIVVSYEANESYPEPQNALEILLKASFIRMKKNYFINSKNCDKIEAEETFENPFVIKVFFNGSEKAKKYLEGNK